MAHIGTYGKDDHGDGFSKAEDFSFRDVDEAEKWLRMWKQSWSALEEEEKEERKRQALSALKEEQERWRQASSAIQDWGLRQDDLEKLSAGATDKQLKVSQSQRLDTTLPILTPLLISDAGSKPSCPACIS